VTGQDWWQGSLMNIFNNAEPVPVLERGFLMLLQLLTCIVADHREVLDAGLEEAADEVLRDATEAEASHQQPGPVRHLLNHKGHISNEQANAGPGFGSDTNADPKLRYGTVKAKQGTGTI
jgi:hypothetical protein